MSFVQRLIAGLATFLWLVPPVVLMHLSPPASFSFAKEPALVWLHYFAFALVAYVLTRRAQPEARKPVIIGICVSAFVVEVLNAIVFHHGDLESFRSVFFIAALLGTGFGAAWWRFPNRWDEA